MRRAYEALPAAPSARVRGRALAYERRPPPLAAPCLFLEGGRCFIYEARPIICRSQGLPLRSREIAAPDHLTWCPLNFKGFALADFDPSAVLNLDTVNRLLAGLVREEEAERSGATGSPGRRLTMTDIVLRPERCEPLAVKEG